MRELIVFAAVGIGATFTHYTVALLLVEFSGTAVLIANVIAYCSAVAVSFFGHSLFTFKVALSQARLAKFVVVSLAALCLSQALLAFLMATARFDYRVNLIFVVAFVPVVSYLLNKFWVYKP